MKYRIETSMPIIGSVMVVAEIDIPDGVNPEDWIEANITPEMIEQNYVSSDDPDWEWHRSAFDTTDIKDLEAA
jgi:hypothetical protein